MSKRAIADVRPSQIITTFGPGAIVDLQTTSVIVAGIDNWPIEEEMVIREPRLEQALRVKRFFPAMPSEGSFYSKLGTVPAYLFPRYQLCPICRTLSCFGEGNVRYNSKRQEVECTAPGCKGQGRGQFHATTLPAPFVVACPSGHIDDFPWRQYVHRGPTSCRGRMKLYSVAKTGSVADIMVSCECKKTRSASDAFGEQRSEALGQCTRHRPWLGIDNRDTKSCVNASEVRPIQRGATNGWFPDVRSALAVKESATPIGRTLNTLNPKQIEKIDSIDKLKKIIETEMFPGLNAFPLLDLWNEIQRRHGKIEMEEIDLRWPEWLAFQDVESNMDENSEFFLEQGEVPAGWKEEIGQVVLARKLLEVRALLGFTRIDPAGVGTNDGTSATIAPIYRNRTDWLPAVQVRGEGIFIELNETAVSLWETKSAVQNRAQAMAEKFRQWEEDRNSGPSPFPGARYVLLHSLAHALIRQLSLDCGYPASSVRERIYSSMDPNKPMAGVLLYTASPDSEGGLGGLVDLGNPKRFPDLLSGALQSIIHCSSDPLCADHKPDVHATINGAACHACILASETSCESFNRFLDRNFLVSTMATDSVAFFRLQSYSHEKK